jgi:hypothetical protein
MDADRLVARMHKAYTHYNESPEKSIRIDMALVLEELPVKLTPIEDRGRMRKDSLPPSVATLLQVDFVEMANALSRSDNECPMAT